MKMLPKWAFTLCLFLSVLFTNVALAQTADAGETTMVEANASATDIEMADRLRADGKIYIVVACVLVVLAGMIFYLISLDKKVSNLEKQIKS